MSRKEYMNWQNRNKSSLRIHLCASKRSKRAIFGVFNSFTVKKVSFFTINVKCKVILSSNSGGGGGCLYRPSPPPPPKKVGGYIPPPPPPGFTPVIYLFIHSFIHLSIYLFIYLLIYLFIYLFNYLSIYLFTIHRLD